VHLTENRLRNNGMKDRMQRSLHVVIDKPAPPDRLLVAPASRSSAAHEIYARPAFRRHYKVVRMTLRCRRRDSWEMRLRCIRSFIPLFATCFRLDALATYPIWSRAAKRQLSRPTQFSLLYVVGFRLLGSEA